MLQCQQKNAYAMSEIAFCFRDLPLMLIPENFDSDFQRLEHASDPVAWNSYLWGGSAT